MDAIVLDFGAGDDAVEGECLLEGEDKKILCTSIGYGQTMPVGWNVSNMKRTKGRIEMEQFEVVKKIDIATPKLNFCACVGREWEAVKIRCYQADGEDHFKLYLEYTLSNAVISTMMSTGGGDDLGEETITFDYSKIKWEYTQQLVDVAQAGKSAYEFDVAKAKGGAAS